MSQGSIRRRSFATRRTAFVIAAVGTCAATTVLAQDPELERPVISSIVVTPETVWFCPNRQAAGNARTYYRWLRRSNSWQNGSTATPVCAHRAPVRQDTLSLGRGVIVTRSALERQPTGRLLRRHLALFDSVSGRRLDLTPPVDAGVRARIHGMGMAPDTISTQVTAWVVDDTIAWLGLGGGFGEATDAEFGGLYRVDRRTGDVAFTLDDTLQETSITSLVATPPWLWVGTQIEGEYGFHGWQGLLRLDLRTGVWRAYTDHSSPLPGLQIRALTSDGRVLAIATDAGLAVVDLAEGQTPGVGEPITAWHAARFRPGFIGDSLVADIRPSPDSRPDTVAESSWETVQRFAARGHERALYEALTANGDDRSATPPTGTISAPAIATALVPLLSGPPEAAQIAAASLARLGARAPRSATDALRKAFLKADSSSGDDGYRPGTLTALGLALAPLGDSTAVRWARTSLEKVIDARPTGTAANAQLTGRTSSGLSSRDATNVGVAGQVLRAVHDRLGLNLLVTVIAVTNGVGQGSIVISQLGLYDEPIAWKAILDDGRAGVNPARRALGALQPSTLRDAGVAASVRAYLAALATDSLIHQRAVFAEYALAVARLRLIELAPVLIDRLGQTPPNPDDGLVAIRALVSLSGHADAPVFREPAPPPAVYDWWRQWLASHDRSREAVPIDSGDAAERLWDSRLRAARAGG